MGNAIPARHPAVVLRSQFKQLRALLAIAMVAVVGLTVAVVILANDDSDNSAIPAASQSSLTPQTQRWQEYNQAIGTMSPKELDSTFGGNTVAPGSRYDGGPDEGTRGIVSTPNATAPSKPGTRYDGGPEEGTSATVTPAPSASDDGGSELSNRSPGSHTN
jgi:hypothetical protein